MWFDLGWVGDGDGVNLGVREDPSGWGRVGFAIEGVLVIRPPMMRSRAVGGLCGRGMEAVIVVRRTVRAAMRKDFRQKRSSFPRRSWPHARPKRGGSISITPATGPSNDCRVQHSSRRSHFITSRAPHIHEASIEYHVISLLMSALRRHPTHRLLAASSLLIFTARMS